MVDSVAIIDLNKTFDRYVENPECTVISMDHIKYLFAREKGLVPSNQIFDQQIKLLRLQIDLLNWVNEVTNESTEYNPRVVLARDYLDCYSQQKTSFNIDAKNLSSLPNLSPLAHLRHLEITNEVNLQQLPDLSGFLHLENFPYFSEDLQLREWVEAAKDTEEYGPRQKVALEIKDCYIKSSSELIIINHKITSLPEFRTLSSLKRLKIKGLELKSLPDLSTLNSLTELIFACPNLEYLPKLSSNYHLKMLDIEALRRSYENLSPKGRFWFRVNTDSSIFEEITQKRVYPE